MSEDLKERILSTAGDLFEKRGVRVVTIDDICRGLGISKKTFYLFYPSKESLIEAVLSDRMERKISLIGKKVSSRSIVENLLQFQNFLLRQKGEEYDSALVSDLQKYYPEIFRKAQCERYQQIRQYALDYMKRGVEEGIFRPGVDYEAEMFLLEILRRALIEGEKRGFIDSKEFPRKRMTSAFTDITLCSILSDEGWRQYKEALSKQE